MPTPEQLARDLRSQLAKVQAEQRAPSVSGAVVRNGELIWAEAIGLANTEDGSAATPETQYRIGSITKTFSAVAVMQLRDAGRLDLEDPLSRLIPEAPHGDVTVRRLLTHLSGLQRELPGDVWETLELPEIEQLVAELDQTERVLHPQVAHHYSNLAYALLGDIVARAAGASYRDVVDERILGPLGLGRTTWEPVAPFAQGYLVEPYEDVARREQHVDLRGASSAGQLWSTTGDLCAWATFLAEGRDGVLAKETVESMWFPHVMWDPDAWTLGWGLGLMLYRRDGRIFAGHGGGMPGHLSGVFVSRRDGIGAAALTNSSAGPNMELLAIELAEAAIEALPAEPEPWRPGEAAPERLRGALGRWWSEGTEFVFFWQEGQLKARLEKAPPERAPAVFEPEGEDVFRTVSGREQGELLRFVRADTGEIVRMYWATYPFTRAPGVFGSK